MPNVTPGEVLVVNKYKHSPNHETDVYVGRGSPLGNPFPINASIGHTREIVIEAYEEWLSDQINKHKRPAVINMLNQLVERSIAGQRTNLVCFCAPQKCHADFIKKLVDHAVQNHLKD